MIIPYAGDNKMKRMRPMHRRRHEKFRVERRLAGTRADKAIGKQMDAVWQRKLWLRRWVEDVSPLRGRLSMYQKNTGASYNGSTWGFGPHGVGSIPTAPAKRRNNMKPDSPCHYCVDRLPGCSANCKKEDYLAWQKAITDQKKRIKEAQDRERNLNSFAINSALRNKRRRRGK